MTTKVEAIKISVVLCASIPYVAQRKEERHP